MRHPKDSENMAITTSVPIDTETRAMTELPVTADPAPWFLTDIRLSGPRHVRAWIPSEDKWARPYARTIATIVEHENAEANAAVIVSAPELLALLKEFQALYDAHTREMCGRSMLERLARVDAAIAKAEGRSSGVEA